MQTLQTALAAACKRVGRDVSSITVTAGIAVRYPEASVRTTPPAPTGAPTHIARGLAAHADVGVDHATVVLEPADNGNDPRWLASAPRAGQHELRLL